MKEFAGAYLAVELNGLTASKPGEHLELWARDQYNDFILIQALYDETAGNTRAAHGFQIRLAVDPQDPCIIDSRGNLLTSPDAYSTLTAAGVTQTPLQQAQQVRNRIRVLNQPSATNAQPLFAFVPFDESGAVRPDSDIDPAVPAAQRLTDCNAYWGRMNDAHPEKDLHPLAYTGNPLQPTGPIHGVENGFVSYSTPTPPIAYSGIRLVSPIRLAGVQEMWMTLENQPTAMVGPYTRTAVLLDGLMDRGGRDALHFTLASPLPGIQGKATIFFNLNQDSVF